MSTLEDILAVNLTSAQWSVIKKLYKLIFEEDGGRNNRQKVRKFGGFEFSIDSEEYRDKINYINENFSTNDLIAFANILHIDYDCEKEMLIENVCKNLTDLSLLQKNSEENEEQENDDEEVEDEFDKVSVYSSPSLRNNLMFSMNFRDVEDSIHKFDGRSGYPVEKWIQDLEDMATLFSWNDLQFFIFAKKSLDGLAKLFIQGEKSINSWIKLKKILLSEYGSRLNSATLHKMLQERVKNKNESIHEYFLIIKELASRGKIENDALIQYVIDGIPDDTNNKIMLYGTKSLNEFKEMLKIYENIKLQTSNRTYKSNDKNYNKEHFIKQDIKPCPKVPNPQDDLYNSKVRCFNCGTKGHKSNVCKHKKFGVKCFKCNNFGHKSFECPEQKTGQAVNNKTSIRKIESTTPTNMNKCIQIDDLEIFALIDTGSQVNIIKSESHKKLGSPVLQKSNILLNGFGKSSVATIGNFYCEMVIDNQNFNTRFYVVSDEIMEKIDAILGNEFLQTIDLTINQDGIKIKKLKSNDEVKEKDIMSIDLQNNVELDIGDVNRVMKCEIENMVINYEPVKSKCTNIEMKIIMTDEEPIYCSPRRLPFFEREIVDRQVEEWIEDGVVEPCYSDYTSPVVVVKKRMVHREFASIIEKLIEKLLKIDSHYLL